MSETETPPADVPRWWETLHPGDPVALGIVKIDRKGSTDEKRVLAASLVAERYDRYTAAVEAVARGWDAAPLRWQGDGVMLFIPDAKDALDRVDPCEVRAFRAAVQLLESIAYGLGLPVRIAVHAAEVAWNPDPGKLLHSQIDVCGHLEHVAPVNAILVHEDVAEALPRSDAQQVAWMGVTKRDGTPCRVYPPGLAATQSPDIDPTHPPGSDVRTAVLRYTQGPNVRTLKYVGVRLRRLVDPPSLDILDVFVEPSVRRMGRGSGDLRDAFEGRERRRHFARDAKATSDAELPDDGPDSSDPWCRPFARESIQSSAPERLGAVLARSRNVVLVGEPGSGKSTVCKWLAVCAAGGRAALRRAVGIDERVVPILVSVGALAEDWERHHEDAAWAIARCLAQNHVGEPAAIREWLLARLDFREALVILDGLDEVASSSRGAVVSWLESFVGQYAGNRFVVTSRPAGFGGFAFAGESEVHTIEPFEDEQVDRYVRHFTLAYRHWETTQAGSPNTADADGLKQADDLLARLRQNARLAQIVRNAFLLSIACLVHRAEGQLPGHRVGFYEIVAETLAETWEEARRLQAGSTGASARYSDEARRILGRLGFAMHQRYPRGLAPRDEILKLLAHALHEEQAIPIQESAIVAAEFLRLVGDRLHLLVERSPGQWGFFHLTFQEFFAAVWLCLDESLETEGLKHLLDPRWEEVLRLAVGYAGVQQGRTKAVSSFLERVLAYHAAGADAWRTDVLFRHHALAALFLAEAGRAVRPEVADRVVEAFVERLFAAELAPPDRYAREIGACDAGSRFAARLVNELASPDAVRRATAARSLAALQARDQTPAILPLPTDTEDRVRSSATQALRAIHARDQAPAMLRLLDGCVGWVRFEAAWALWDIAERTPPAES
ncbi:MAG: NACHT domain-containing protein [Planctomycetes bacterium]|nr:NACHT domain-containing protein [Planctomycetota bacterium]